MLIESAKDDGTNAGVGSKPAPAAGGQSAVSDSTSSVAGSAGLIALDLQLLQTAALFDLSSRDGRYRSNAALSALFLRLHNLLRPDVIFEIGAREATFSSQVRRHAPDAKIYAFEANPHNYAKFRSQPALKEANVEYLHLAVSNGPGEVSFFMQKLRKGKPVSPNAGSHSLLERVGSVDQERIAVPATSIAAFIEQNQLSGTFSAWIDVEGATKNVFAGMASNIAKFAMILCEVEELAHWKDQWLWSDVLRFMIEQGFIPVARDFEYMGQNNVIFLRSDVLAKPDVRFMLTKHFSALGRSVLQRDVTETPRSDLEQAGIEAKGS